MGSLINFLISLVMSVTFGEEMPIQTATAQIQSNDPPTEIFMILKERQEILTA